MTTDLPQKFTEFIETINDDKVTISLDEIVTDLLKNMCIEDLYAIWVILYYCDPKVVEKDDDMFTSYFIYNLYQSDIVIFTNSRYSIDLLNLRNRYNILNIKNIELMIIGKILQYINGPDYFPHAAQKEDKRPLEYYRARESAWFLYRESILCPELKSVNFNKIYDLILKSMLDVAPPAKVKKLIEIASHMLTNSSEKRKLKLCIENYLYQLQHFPRIASNIMFIYLRIDEQANKDEEILTALLGIVLQANKQLTVQKNHYLNYFDFSLENLSSEISDKIYLKNYHYPNDNVDSFFRAKGILS